MPSSIEELKKVSYLDVTDLQGRTIQLMPLWDGSRWRMWIDTEVGIFEGQMVDAIESDYVATEAAKDTDLFIPFVHLMWQHASYPDIAGLIVAISDDFHNMGTSAAKLKHFWKFQENIGQGGVSRFVSTELEYLVALCRTVFDLLQEVICRLWAGYVQLLDADAEAFRKGHKLPDTFSRMVLDNKESVRNSEQIAIKFGLPSVLAQQYAAAGTFFDQLRAIRNKVIHGGTGFRHIFETERGFCINPSSAPFNDFKGWLPDHKYNENLSSVLPWIADVVGRTISTCNALMGTFAQTIKLPSAIAPGHFIFVRGPHNEALVSLIEISQGKSPWWDKGIEDCQKAKPDC